MRFVEFVKAHPFLARLAVMAAGLLGDYLRKVVGDAMRDDVGPDFADDE